MRTLSDTLKAEQKKLNHDVPLAKIVLTKAGEDTQTYGTERIIDLRYSEEAHQNAEVLLNNWDGALTSLDLTGYKGVVSLGFTTSEGDEYSPRAPLWVIPQQLFSLWHAKYPLLCRLSLAGILNFMAEDRASADYVPDSDDSKTVKTLIREICGDSGVTQLACFNHCAKYDVVFDSEDALIDVFEPKDSFSVRVEERRETKIDELLSWTGCVWRAEADGKIHIFVPKVVTSTAWEAESGYNLGDQVIPVTPNGYQYICTTAGTSGAEEPTWPTGIGDTVGDGSAVWTVAYDYEYSLASGEHGFFDKTLRRRVVIPGKITVASHPSHEEEYSGSAQVDGYDSLPDALKIAETRHLRLSSDAQGVAIATAFLAHAKRDAETGHGFAPMNIGAEVHDYVKITDSRQGDSAVGNIGYLSAHYTPGHFDFEFRFGSIYQSGLAGTMPPGASTGGTHPSNQQLWDEINRLWAKINEIIAWLNAWKCPLADYIKINAAGDIVLQPKFGSWVQLLGDLSLVGDENLGMMLAAAAGIVQWYTKGGTLEHVFGPDVTGHGKKGDAGHHWGEDHTNKVYAYTRLKIPVGTDMYD